MLFYTPLACKDSPQHLLQLLPEAASPAITASTKFDGGCPELVEPECSFSLRL
jgi:hypothetical protein